MSFVPIVPVSKEADSNDAGMTVDLPVSACRRVHTYRNANVRCVLVTSKEKEDIFKGYTKNPFLL